jgi:hypothetical protein
VTFKQERTLKGKSLVVCAGIVLATSVTSYFICHLKLTSPGGTKKDDEDLYHGGNSAAMVSSVQMPNGPDKGLVSIDKQEKLALLKDNTENIDNELRTLTQDISGSGWRAHDKNKQTPEIIERILKPIREDYSGITSLVSNLAIRTGGNDSKVLFTGKLTVEYPDKAKIDISSEGNGERVVSEIDGLLWRQTTTHHDGTTTTEIGPVEETGLIFFTQFKTLNQVNYSSIEEVLIEYPRGSGTQIQTFMLSGLRNAKDDISLFIDKQSNRLVRIVLRHENGKVVNETEFGDFEKINEHFYYPRKMIFVSPERSETTILTLSDIKLGIPYSYNAVEPP